MKLRRLIVRNLSYYWRTNIAIIIGIAASVAVFSGALLVGQSVRDSLRRLLFERMGSTEYIVASDHFFSESLADAAASADAVASADAEALKGRSCPIISLKGTIIHEQNGIRANAVNIYGVDDRFWKFQNLADQKFQGDRDAFLGSTLAVQLNAQPGDGLLLRVETQQDIPREWLYGRRDNVGKTIRLHCRTILPSDKLGDFSLRPTQGSVYAIFVPLSRLQKDLGQRTGANIILIGSLPSGSPLSSGPLSSGRIQIIQDSLRKHCSLEDLGLKLRTLPSGDGFSLESNRIILDDTTANAAVQTAAALSMKTSALYTYLANSFRANNKEIPYSAVTAADLGAGALESIQTPRTSPQQNPNDSIWLTDYAARELAVSPGQPVEMDYYFWQENGKLTVRTARFLLAGVVPLSGEVNDSLSPKIPGITEAHSMSSWDPPFPLDLNRIRQKDEEYWNRYRATPKAFITLARGQQLWGNRFGKLTALRIMPSAAATTESSMELFSRTFLGVVDPARAGFSIQAVREQGLAASRGSTDFGEYFVYFSFFLIIAAIILAALFFKLMIEQRVRELGILQTAGFPAGLLRRIFLIEGMILSVAGSLLGLLGSLVYSWVMIFGLRTWWVGAVGTRRLSVSISLTDLSIGLAAGIGFSLAVIVWTLRNLTRNSPRMLLAGVLESRVQQRRRSRAYQIASALAATAAGLLLLCSFLARISQLAGFFGAGFFLLLSILFITAFYLRRANPGLIRGSGWQALFRLGMRNAMYRPARSLLCSGLIASAVFIVVSMEAFRQDPRSISLAPQSGTGGYAFIAESDLPIVYDLNSDEGRETAGIPETDFKKAVFTSFRERPGDDVSCLNLYAPQEPRILGVPQSALSGRFSFRDSLASNQEQKSDPWLLLQSPAADPVIPAVADANTIQYILHRSLGDELAVRGSNGNSVRLRLVAALKDSIFQGEILISESNFLRVFPDRQGYRFFLLNIPQGGPAALIPQLRERLSEWGFHIESSQERLSSYHRVENAYLSTFQSLGSLGIILGVAGLAAVLLRNVLERRRELALLTAVGYRRKVLSLIVLAENAALIVWGLASGVLCALLAIMPALYSRGASFPFARTTVVLVAILGAGLISILLAVIAAFRSPLLTSLHSE